MALILITDLDQTLMDILGHVVECHRTALAARGDHRSHARICKEARYDSTYARTVPGWEHRARTHRGVMRLLRRFAQEDRRQNGHR